MEKTKEIPENFVQEPEKAEHIGRAENPYRILAKNAFKLGNEEKAKKIFRKSWDQIRKSGKGMGR